MRFKDMRMKTLLWAALCVAFCTGTAVAADCTRFSAMDGDGNGTLDLQEFTKAYPQIHEAAFLAMDSNGDKTLTCEEWGAFLEAHRKGQMAMPPAEKAPRACPASGHGKTMPLITPPAGAR